jgi:hypothetical protein
VNTHTIAPMKRSYDLNTFRFSGMNQWEHTAHAILLIRGNQKTKINY